MLTDLLVGRGKKEEFKKLLTETSSRRTRTGCGTCRSWGFSRPSCWRRAGSRAGFCWMACLMCRNWGWVRRNASGFSPRAQKEWATVRVLSSFNISTRKLVWACSCDPCVCLGLVTSTMLHTMTAARPAQTANHLFFDSKDWTAVLHAFMSTRTVMSF